MVALKNTLVAWLWLLSEVGLAKVAGWHWQKVAISKVLSWSVVSGAYYRQGKIH